MDSQKRSPANSQCLTCLLLGENTHETHMEKRKKFYLFLDLNFAIPKESTQKIVCKNESKRFSHPQVSPFFCATILTFCPAGALTASTTPDQKKLEDCLRELLWSSRLQILFLYDSLAKWNEYFRIFFARSGHIHAGWDEDG